MLSCTGQFIVHTNEAARVRAAMQLRENMANDHETMSRTQLQRIYQVICCRELYARAHGRGQANAMNLAAEYVKVRMAKGREVISKSFIDTALTIHGRVLGIPAAEMLLLDMGNLQRKRQPVQHDAALASCCLQARQQ